jgi:hypothetical protein
MTKGIFRLPLMMLLLLLLLLTLPIILPIATITIHGATSRTCAATGMGSSWTGHLRIL